MVRGVVGELGTLHPDQVTILDMEASIEHLTRGTLKHVDILLIVTEPYFRALQTLGRTVPLARELGIPTMHVIANKVRSTSDERAIRDYARRLDLDVLSVVPYDDAVQDADRRNSSLVDAVKNSPALEAISRIVLTLDPEDRPVGAAAD